MLTKIKCDQFRTEVVEFHKGLNVVLGDSKASNSIGKTSMLLIIDFAFGGDSFITTKQDAIDELGDHNYFITFNFDGNEYVFKRGTFRPDIVIKCTNELEEIEHIKLSEYKAFLRKEYGIADEELPFRSFISLFSRVWGKGNLDVQKPLHAHPSEKAVLCVDRVLKIYKKYDFIKELSQKLKTISDEKSALSNAFKKRIIPKINKTKFNENQEKIEDIELEIKDIKDNLSKYATNISEIVNREILDLKLEKDELLKIKFVLEGKLLGIRNNLSDNKYIKSRHLKSLTKYFPNVDLDKLAEIELFHGDLSKILKKELKQSEREFDAQLKELNNEIQIIDEYISEKLSNLNNPTEIVDRVFELTTTFSEVNKENKFYKAQKDLIETVKENKGELAKEKLKVTKFVEDVVNNKIRDLITKIYSVNRKSPELSISENNYSYDIFEDTGTGKAYSNLLILDLAVFSTSNLPIIIHDSLLYKNIENDAVANFIDQYTTYSKQSFISIDESEKYGEAATKQLLENKVIQLTDSQVLYVKDWRKE